MLSLEGESKGWSEGEMVKRSDFGEDGFLMAMNKELRSAGTEFVSCSWTHSIRDTLYCKRHSFLAFKHYD